MLTDGTELPADLIVYATGYQPMNEWWRRSSRRRSPTGSARAGATARARRGDPGPWEGELRNMWKPTPPGGLWFHGGNLHLSRHYSLYVALQIKARMEGIADAGVLNARRGRRPASGGRRGMLGARPFRIFPEAVGHPDRREKAESARGGADVGEAVADIEQTRVGVDHLDPLRHHRAERRHQVVDRDPGAAAGVEGAADALCRGRLEIGLDDVPTLTKSRVWSPSPKMVIGSPAAS